MKPAEFIVVGALLVMSAPLAAQSWSPQKNVEIVAASAPGGSNDKTARMLERVIGATKLVDTSLTVVNKPGGGATDRAHVRAPAPGRPALPAGPDERDSEQPHHRREHAQLSPISRRSRRSRGLHGVRRHRRIADQDRQGSRRAAEEGSEVGHDRIRQRVRKHAATSPRAC